MLFRGLKYFQKACVLAPVLKANICQTKVIKLRSADVNVGLASEEIRFGFEGYLNLFKIKFPFSPAYYSWHLISQRMTFSWPFTFGLSLVHRALAWGQGVKAPWNVIWSGETTSITEGVIANPQHSGQFGRLSHSQHLSSCFTHVHVYYHGFFPSDPFLRCCF